MATRVFQRCWSSGCTLHPQSHTIELVESIPTVLDSHNCRGLIILACLTSVAHQLCSALQVSCFFGCQPCSASPLLSSPACRCSRSLPAASVLNACFLYQDSRVLQPRSQYLHCHLHASRWTSLCFRGNARLSATNVDWVVNQVRRFF